MTGIPDERTSRERSGQFWCGKCDLATLTVILNYAHESNCHNLTSVQFIIALQAVMSARGNETGTCEWHGPACFNTLSDAFCQSNTWYCCRFQPCQGLCQRACDRCLWWWRKSLLTMYLWKLWALSDVLLLSKVFVVSLLPGKFCSCTFDLYSLKLTLKWLGNELRLIRH